MSILSFAPDLPAGRLQPHHYSFLHKTPISHIPISAFWLPLFFNSRIERIAYGEDGDSHYLYVLTGRIQLLNICVTLSFVILLL